VLVGTTLPSQRTENRQTLMRTVGGLAVDAGFITRQQSVSNSSLSNICPHQRGARLPSEVASSRATVAAGSADNSRLRRRGDRRAVVRCQRPFESVALMVKLSVADGGTLNTPCCCSR
jgi:hypothetical protein